MAPEPLHLGTRARLPSEDYNKPAAISASGSRYTDEKVEFWEHQGEAMLNGIPGESYDGCKIPEPS